ncbi:MAG: hypothetical protein QOF66_5182, partial [Mycobacterium sp.]|nr:hypothetical protein [Mycobacterium sp.]
WIFSPGLGPLASFLWADYGEFLCAALTLIELGERELKSMDPQAP